MPRHQFLSIRKEIRAAVDRFKPPSALVPRTRRYVASPGGFGSSSWKERYQVSCNTIAANLIWWHVSMVTSVVLESLKSATVPDGWEIVATKQPLP